MATIKNLFSGEYIAGGRYRQYEDQIVGNVALQKIFNLKDKGFKFAGMGKGYVEMKNFETGKTHTVYFPA